jgi:hypothetical protein
MHLRGNAVCLQDALDEMSFCRVLSDEDLLHETLPDILRWPLFLRQPRICGLSCHTT